MFVKVHKPVNTPCVCDNKDRCRALVEYLLKESLEDKPYYDTFFSLRKFSAYRSIQFRE